MAAAAGGGGGVGGGGVKEAPGVYVAEADLEPSEVQDLGEAIPKLLNIIAATNTVLQFHIRVVAGSDKKPADKIVAQKLNVALKGIRGSLELR
jgi:hypothetical protein